MDGRVGSSDYLPCSSAWVPNMRVGTKCLCPNRARPDWGLVQLSNTTAIFWIVRSVKINTFRGTYYIFYSNDVLQHKKQSLALNNFLSLCLTSDQQGSEKNPKDKNHQHFSRNVNFEDVHKITQHHAHWFFLPCVWWVLIKQKDFIECSHTLRKVAASLYFPPLQGSFSVENNFQVYSLRLGILGRANLASWALQTCPILL